MTSRHPHVANLEDIPPKELAHGGFVHRARRFGPATGAKALGCAHFEVPPGKTASPYHWHSAFEEGLFILDGSGELRIGKDTVTVRAGDFVSLPPGPDTSHQLTNRGTTPLRYLAMSAPAVPMTLDIVAYPDSKKISFASGVDPGKQGWTDNAWLIKVIKEDQPKIDYYADEPREKE